MDREDPEQAAFDRRFPPAVAKAARTGGSFRFSEVARFAWDRALLRTAYTEETVAEDLGVRGGRLEDVHEGEMTWFFAKGDRAVAALSFTLIPAGRECGGLSIVDRRRDRMRVVRARRSIGGVYAGP